MSYPQTMFLAGFFLGWIAAITVFMIVVSHGEA